MPVSPESATAPAIAVSPSNPAEFGRTARAILVTMVLLIVALTGILVETTRRNPSGQVEVIPPDPGSFAQR
jgi:hypothetical protein